MATETSLDSGGSNRVRSLWKTIAPLVGLVFLCATAGGFLIGRSNSPKYDSEAGDLYLRREVLVDAVGIYGNPDLHMNKLLYAKLFGPKHGSLKPTIRMEGDDLVLETPPEFELHYACGHAEFVYTYPSQKLDRQPVDFEGPLDLPRAGIDYLAALTWIAGGASAVSLPKVVPDIVASLEAVPEGALSKYAKLLLIPAAGVVGGYFGYKLGYINEPHCVDPYFQRLLNDTTFWEGAAHIYQKSFSLRFRFVDDVNDWIVDSDNFRVAPTAKWREAVKDGIIILRKTLEPQRSSGIRIFFPEAYEGFEWQRAANIARFVGNKPLLDALERTYGSRADVVPVLRVEEWDGHFYRQAHAEERAIIRQMLR